MDTYYYILLLIFTILAVMVVDPNVATYITLLIKIVLNQIQRYWWMIRFHPNNFITTWIRSREYDRIAKELQEEMERQRNKLNDNSKID